MQLQLPENMKHRTSTSSTPSSTLSKNSTVEEKHRLRMIVCPSKLRNAWRDQREKGVGVVIPHGLSSNLWSD